jgi:hypothetical protein
MVVLAGLVCLHGWDAALNRKVRPGLVRIHPAQLVGATAAADPACKAAELLGGFRSLAADMVWLRANVLWEGRERIRLERTLHLVTALDPRPLLFWLNGARMIAFDVPAWRIADSGGNALPATIQDRIRAEQAEQALAWLDRAAIFHPDSPAILIERANICLYGRRDLAAAADWYRQAAELPDTPVYAGRIHAELLRRLGRREEALAWLIRFHAQRSRGDSSAAADLVLEQIRVLEAELGAPAHLRHRGGSVAAPGGQGIGL